MTIAVLNYNGLDVLPACLASVRGLDHPPGEVILVDDGSTDGSPESAKKHFPEIRLVKLGTNTGRLNKVRNRALREARHDVVLLLDNDMSLAPDALDHLVQALQCLPDAAVCTPRLLYESDPGTIYQDGQTLHYVGATGAWTRDIPADEGDNAPRLTIGLGGAQLIDRRLALEVGGFNEEYLMGWGDDGEFNYRMNLARRYCYHVPWARAYHKRVSAAGRYYGSTRNRWRFLLECYQARTLLVCMPALVAYELATLGFLTVKGALGEYLRAALYVLRNLPGILATRRAVQRSRRVADRELMTSGDVYIGGGYIDSGLLSLGVTVLNGFLNRYWTVARTVL